MLTTSSAYFSARRVANPDSNIRDEITSFNASFPSVAALQIMRDAGIEEFTVTVKLNGLQVGGTMSEMSGPARHLNRTLSEESWNGNTEFVLHIDGQTFETYNS